MARRRAEAASRAEREEYLALLEEKRRRLAHNNLNEYCRQIEVPGVPLGTDVPDDADLPDDDSDVPASAWDCEEFYPTTVEPAEHHRLINDALMKVEAGEIRRLMIFMPPGSAKSTYGSVVFPTWFMGRKPGRNVICTSYNSTLAGRFGRRCRQITRSPRFRDLFGSELVADNRAADDWSLTNGSTYMAAGILAGVTGNRADGLVIDDPVKNRADADSKTIRDKMWEEYRLSLRTRVKPGGFIVYIGTRWHEDDIAGRILPEGWAGESGWITARDGERWYVLCLQAQCDRSDDPLGRKPGEWLWPEWFTPEHWEQERRTQMQDGGARGWSALYQQRPTPSEGGMVKRAWIRHWQPAPGEDARAFARRMGLQTFQAWDCNQKASAASDFTVGQVWGVKWPDVYLLDQVRARMDIPDMLRAVETLSAKWPRATLKLIEEAAGGHTVLQMLRGKIPGLVAVPPKGSKAARLQAVSPLIEAGNVYLPPLSLAPWVVDFVEELVTFTGAGDAHDDQVDAAVHALTRASQMGGGPMDVDAIRRMSAPDTSTKPAASGIIGGRGFSRGAR